MKRAIQRIRRVVRRQHAVAAAGLIFAASFFTSVAFARMAGSWGGSIVMVDLGSGTVIHELEEPYIFAGYTGGSVSLSLDLNPKKSLLRARWRDVVIDPRGIKFTKVDAMGVPSEMVKREMQLSSLDLSTKAATSSGPWTKAEVKVLPYYSPKSVSGKELPPLRINWELWDGYLLLGKDRIYTSTGEELECYERASGKKLWTLDLNPSNGALAGSSPEVAVIELGEMTLVVTDRLGLRAVENRSGRVLWHLKYSNLDAIPMIAKVQNRLIVGPISEVGKDPY